MKIHMIGIKGSGMSALALVLKGLGHIVSGSDVKDYMFTQDELEKALIQIKDFNISNLDDMDLIVVGHNFISSDNIEVIESKKRKLMILEYNECLGLLIRDFYSIGVSGSNGKTTTTGLISSILNEEEETSYLIGSGEGSGNKKSRYFTFEACEYRRHFLKYFPNLILINNVDYDHTDYYLTREDYLKAFYEFANNGVDKIVVNGDYKELKKIKGSITFGLGQDCDFVAKNINYDEGIKYDLYYKKEYIETIKLNLYGEHMIYNTLAAISVCYSIGISIEKIINGLKNFKGVKRRFKETIIDDDVYIDDYAHHPSKIKAIINAVKLKYKDKKIIAFYRPDRVPRLDYFSSQIAGELNKADEAYILPFIKNNDEEKEAIRRFIYQNKIEVVNEEIYKKIANMKGIVVLMMSSKDVSEVKEKILNYKR